MFTEIPLDTPGVYAFKVSGKLTEEDARTLLPRLSELAEREEKLSLFIELEDFLGWDAGELWDDIRFARKHARDFERIAIVGENSWMHWMTGLAKLFLYADVRFFDRGEEKKALEWLKTAGGASACRPSRYRHLLVATESSRVDACFVWRAAELAGFYGSQLTVMHIVPPRTDYYDDYGPMVPGEVDPLAIDIEDHLVAQARHEIDTILEDVRGDDSLGLPPDAIRSEVRIGYPHSEIVLYAEQQGVDLIVMGTRRHRGLSRLFGSTSSAVLNTARCDVLELRIE